MSNTLRRPARGPVGAGSPLTMRKPFPPPGTPPAGPRCAVRPVAENGREGGSELEDHEVVLTLVDGVVLVPVQEDRQVDRGAPADRLVVGATVDDRGDGD